MLRPRHWNPCKSLSIWDTVVGSEIRLSKQLSFLTYQISLFSRWMHPFGSAVTPGSSSPSFMMVSFTQTTSTKKNMKEGYNKKKVGTGPPRQRVYFVVLNQNKLISSAWISLHCTDLDLLFFNQNFQLNFPRNSCWSGLQLLPVWKFLVPDCKRRIPTLCSRAIIPHQQNGEIFKHSTITPLPLSQKKSTPTF